MYLIDYVLLVAAACVALVAYRILAWLCRGLYYTWKAFWRTPE